MDYKEFCPYLTKSLVVYDIETGDISLETTEILQFSALRINPDSSIKQLNFKCKNTKPISPQASKVNGLTEESLKNEKLFKSYIKKIVEIFNEADICGFNNQKFDDIVLSRQMKENGVEDFLKDKLSFDVHRLYKIHSSRRLSDACLHYLGREITDAHSADGDVKTTAEVLLAQLKKENKKIEEVQEVINAKQDGKDRFITKNDEGQYILGFTKEHKGKKITELDDGLVRWINKASFIPKDVKDIINKEREGK